MKTALEMTVVKNENGTFSARCKWSETNGKVNLKNVTPEEIGNYITEKIKKADEDGTISKR